MAAESPNPSSPESGGWVCPWVDSAPGVWVARLRVTLEKPIVTTGTFEVQGGFELFVDGEPISRSNSSLESHSTSRSEFALDLPAGRHELFVRLWTTLDDAPPVFRLRTARDSALFATGLAPWVSARCENVRMTHPGLARVLVTGEPAGPGGMDRGVDWQDVKQWPGISEGSEHGAVRRSPLADAGTWAMSVAEGEGTIEQFRTVFAPDGLFRVEPDEVAVIRMKLPDVATHVGLRASGGEDAWIRIGTGTDEIGIDAFGPRGFRQDFATLAPFEGPEMSISLHGGTRGLAIFRLEFLREEEA